MDGDLHAWGRCSAACGGEWQALAAAGVAHFADCEMGLSLSEVWVVAGDWERPGERVDFGVCEDVGFGAAAVLDLDFDVEG